MKELICLLFMLNLVKGANILAIFPAPGYSQFILGEKLMSALALKGHNVTVISPYNPKIKLQNYRTISISGLLELFRDENLFLSENNNIFWNTINTYKLGYSLTEYTLKNNQIQELLKSNNETYDLVIVEQFFCEALMGFASHFQTSLVLFSSIGPSEWNNHLMGNPAPASVSPVSHSSFSNHMTFLQRLFNLIVTTFDYFYKHFVAYPYQEDLLKYFPKKIYLDDIIYNASLMLLNSHITTTGNYPLVDGMVRIGGFHITPQKLPENLQKFLDSANNGAILFSMGTNLRSNQLNQEKIQEILAIFSQLPQKIVWKFEGNLGNLPGNVLISKWLPQSDVLAHPKIIAFISHGGLLSITEAVYYGVPIIGIPIFGDQKMNIARAIENGIAIKINFQDLTGNVLLNSIREITKDRYRERSKKMSALIRDQVVPPLDLAVYWVEFVLRHKGFKFPKSGLSWFQFYMLDILGLCLIFCYLIRLVWKRSKSTQKLKIN